ncbi:Pre-rRNA-processing protein esf1 [Coniochaeta hoffmannii]|uniref:Pre-rRNA-processing protein esf1 n=1 Tax=Coniochaeta hoffmannii TaxID=91930 RepID=A0AA38RJL6_9PEZI|nr:Pre-rRNA-processing protein esf1 [Coniochaeta hoffmannii]
MPKDKKHSARDGSAASKIKDSRFANFETDPRFRLPSKKNTKTTIDKRFSRMLKDDDFVAAAAVDRYGRKLKTDSKKKALQRLYQEEEDEGEDRKEDAKLDIELDDDDLVQRELRAADDKFVQRQLRDEDEKYDPARGGGFSSSDDDSDEEEEEEEEENATSAGPGMIQKEEVPTGEITHRIAVVNLDWDHIKSVDLFALFSSFVPLGGSIRKVSIYPSEFGKSRMQKEELEGPPKELFQKKDNDEDDFEGFDSEDEEDEDEDAGDAEDSDEEVKNELIQEGDDADFDSDALRTYQLDRLRYYYAVMICSDPNTAHKIYEATDGSEYLSSSNFLDLRFIPDDVTFDDEPRDECDSVPQGYKPVDFVTDALQHSKVKLTWDMHPEEVSRKETISKAFSGSRADIAENDLKAYLASDSEDDDEDVEDAPAAADATEEPKLSKKELARRKMRAALGLSEEPAPKSSKDAPVGDMEITFTSALSGKADKKNPEEETTIEKYKRKEKERKAKRKEAALAKREGGDKQGEEQDEQAAEPEEDLGFDDPFFTSEDPSKEVKKSSIRKEERKKKREMKEVEAAKNAAEKAQLELLMAGNTNEEADHLDHFDMNEIMRAEKQKGKKGKKAKKGGKDNRGGLQEDFEMPVDDPRFKAVFESHEFAIDPSNPKFKATGAMKKILEEGRKKRKVDDVDRDGDNPQKSTKKPKGPQHGGELSSLVEAVKKKTGGK